MTVTPSFPDREQVYQQLKAAQAEEQAAAVIHYLAKDKEKRLAERLTYIDGVIVGRRLAQQEAADAASR